MKQRRFEALVAPHLAGLFRLAYRFTGNQHDAEDLLQSVLLKLYPRLDELVKVDQLRPWMAKVLYREFVDSKRKSKRWLRLVEPIQEGALDSDYASIMESTAESPDTLFEETRKRRRIGEALTSLNPDQRILVVLHDIEGYTMDELAGILDLSKGTIKSRLHRARQRLRLCLEREPYEPVQRVKGRGG